MPATCTEIAQQLVDLCRKGEFMKAVNAFYSNDVVSVEPMAMPPMPAEMRGLDAVRGKGDWWINNHQVHSMSIGGPFVHGDRFVVTPGPFVQCLSHPQLPNFDGRQRGTEPRAAAASAWHPVQRLP